MTQETKKSENKAPKTSNTENKIPKPNIALKNFKFNTRKKRICFFTQQEIIPDYKDTNIIGKFIAPNKTLSGCFIDQFFKSRSFILFVARFI